jgi:hypothetical protein
MRRLRRKWEDVMTVVTSETGWESADWIDLDEYEEHRRSH